MSIYTRIFINPFTTSDLNFFHFTIIASSLSISTQDLVFMLTLNRLKHFLIYLVIVVNISGFVEFNVARDVHFPIFKLQVQKPISIAIMCKERL